MTQDSAHQYQRLHHQLFFFTVIFDACLLWFLFISGISFTIKNIPTHVSYNAYFVHGVYFLIFSLIFYAIHLPLQFYQGYVWEHKFKLSNQTFFHWLSDHLKQNILGFILGLIFVETLYVFLSKYPTSWWLGMAGFWLFISFVLAKVTPNVIVPLFYKYQVLENNSLKQRILKLFKSNYVALKDIYTINMSAKSKKANAFFCGIGRQRRIVLSDTLLNECTEEEIEVVVVHEIGHLKHKDIIKLLFINTVVVVVGLYCVDKLLKAFLSFYNGQINDIAFFPILLLLLSGFFFFVGPLLNFYSRKLEFAADLYSLEKTQNVHGFTTLMLKLGKQNLSISDPHWLIELFLYDHPSIKKRIEFARNFQRQH